MNARTEVQIIKLGDRPAFVVVPYDQWQAITGQSLADALIPHEVIANMAEKNMSAIAAWRAYRGLSQTELGNLMGGVSQSSVAQIEAVDSKPHKKTLARAAKALGIDVEQLVL